MRYFGMVTMRSSAAYTPYALQSFFECTKLDSGDRFYLIANDDSVAPAMLSNPAINLIQNTSPLGFATNVNRIMRLAAAHEADLYFLNNDLIFTLGWCDALNVPEPAILSSVTNWNYPYRTENFACKRVMELSDYIGHETAMKAIATEHTRNHGGLAPQHVVAFYCVKIPFAVYRAVGELDESFGPAGGEDADYCLRCHLAGFSACLATASFVLHFMGKSTWCGGETAQEQTNREQAFRNAFIAKWGTSLTELILDGNRSVLESNSALQGAFFQGNFRRLTELLRPQPSR